MRIALAGFLLLAACTYGQPSEPPRIVVTNPAYVTIEMGRDRAMQEAADMAQSYCIRTAGPDRNAVPYRTQYRGMVRQETFVCSRPRPT